ncbi:MAG: GNAT family N-acetyltransferase [Candidatus Lariskella arthropodorum]
MTYSKIEQVYIEYFGFLPKKLNFSIEEDSNVTIINCGLDSYTFNIVYGYFQSSVFSTKSKITKCIAGFRLQRFSWWIPPSIGSIELSSYLIHSKYSIEKFEFPMMLCDLTVVSSFAMKTQLIVKQVQNNALLKDFISTIQGVDATIGVFYRKVALELLQQSERLFVGYINNKPVVTGILFIYDDTISGIFRLFTCKEARGKGFGTDMMTYLLNFARNRGNKLVTLVASKLGYSIYKRLGFKVLGKFKYFEYTSNC